MEKDLQQAIELYEQGRLFHQQDDLSNSERAYRRALRIKPDFVEAQNNLGNVLLDQGKLKEATGAYRKALKILPYHPMLLNNLGNVLYLQGEYEKAKKHLHEAIRREPGYADAYTNLGNVLNAQNEPDKAVVFYQQAIEADQGHKDAHINLANALHINGDIEKAVSSYRRAIEIDPSDEDAYNGLGCALLDLEDFEEAINAFQHVIRFNPDHINAYTGMGSALEALGKAEKAIAVCQHAIEKNPKNKNAYNGLGNILKNQGNMQDASYAFQQAIKIDPGFAEAYRQIANIRKYTEYNNEIRAMETLYRQKEISSEQRMHICFGLRKAFEDLGKYDKSFKFAIEANRLKRGTYKYSIADDQGFFAQIKNTFTTDFFSRHANTGDPDKTPIFILGMPRSGTSLVEQILASHSQVFGAGELNILSNLARNLCTNLSIGSFPECVAGLATKIFEQTGTRYIQGIRSYSEKATCIIDKMPHNFLHIGLIKAILPNARIIHCVRAPMDNCLSIFKNYFSGAHKYAYDLNELGHYYKLYNELMEYWKNALPGFIYDVNYEEFVSDQEAQIRTLIKCCGLPWDDACLQFHKTIRTVATISNMQVRLPMYKDSVQLCKNYETQLEPLKKAIYG